MNKLKFCAIGLLLIGLGFGAGKFSNPAKIITKTVVKEVEVIKEKKNVVVITKKTTHKDGTIVEESKTEDKSVTFTDRKSELSTSKITTRDLGLSVHVLAMQNLQRTDKGYEYGVYVKKRVFGNVSVGGMVTDQKSIGISVGLDF